MILQDIDSPGLKLTKHIFRKKPEFNPWREVIYTYTEPVPRPDKRSEPSPRITEEVELAPASASSSTSQSISVTDEVIAITVPSAPEI